MVENSGLIRKIKAGKKIALFREKPIPTLFAEGGSSGASER
jgi:hypothetical protein